VHAHTLSTGIWRLRRVLVHFDSGVSGHRTHSHSLRVTLCGVCAHWCCGEGLGDADVGCIVELSFTLVPSTVHIENCIQYDIHFLLFLLRESPTRTRTHPLPPGARGGRKETRETTSTSSPSVLSLLHWACSVLSAACGPSAMAITTHPGGGGAWWVLASSDTGGDGDGLPVASTSSSVPGALGGSLGRSHPLMHGRLQLAAHRAAASDTQGCSLHQLGLQPASARAAACIS
jgi:hypothetical protein